MAMILRDHGAVPPQALASLAPLLRADIASIEAMFTAVEAAHGSTEVYLRDALRLDDQTLLAVRSQLLA